MDRILIMAAGESSRWDNHLGVKKHMAPIRGKPLIHTTQRQFLDATQDEIWLVSNTDEYLVQDVIAGRSVVLVPPQGTLLEHTGIGMSVPFWTKEGLTIVLLGDVHFSEFGVFKIAKCAPADITWFGRTGPAKYKAHPYKEIFGVAIPLSCHAKMLDAIKLVREKREEWLYAHGGGWLLYRILNNISVFEHKTGPNWIEIDDETDDFDWPNDYDQWKKKFDK